ncbi:MAG: hypothetical protein ACRDND_08660 [Streptosporangiaceae bacterium]
MQVWTDLRTREDGAEHWHARQPGWTLWQTISGRDRDHLRDKLIRHKWLTEQAESLVDEAEPRAAGVPEGLHEVPRAVAGP